MTQAPMFSVIIPTYDRPTFLAEAIDSVLGQTVQDFEVLVVDDGSPRPAQVSRDERVRLIRREHRGGEAAARNTGLAHARGRFVCFLDDDDLYAPARLEAAAMHVDRAPLVVTWARYIGGEESRGRWLEGDVSERILDGMTPPLGTVTIRRDVVLPFDEGFAALPDVEWWLRQSQVCRVAAADSFCYLVRRHDGPRVGYGTAARIDCSLKLLDRHRDYFRQHPAAASFRWKRIALMRLSVADRGGARSALLRSLAAHPEPRTAWHLIRATLPGLGGRSDGGQRS